MKLREDSHALTFILLVDRYVLLRGLVTDHRVKQGTNSLSLLLFLISLSPLSSLSLLPTFFLFSPAVHPPPIRPFSLCKFWTLFRLWSDIHRRNCFTSLRQNSCWYYLFPCQRLLAPQQCKAKWITSNSLLWQVKLPWLTLQWSGWGSLICPTLLALQEAVENSTNSWWPPQSWWPSHLSSECLNTSSVWS